MLTGVDLFGFEHDGRRQQATYHTEHCQGEQGNHEDWHTVPPSTFSNPTARSTVMEVTALRDLWK